ncbi:MAG: YIP1 family protein [Deltaproteobacteria bacterium]|nr:YIP1 family protein [Deltaproteobacteria bacterium]
MASMVDRMIRAAKLDASLYEEVEADTTAMGQATGVVLLSSLAGGIGSIGEMGAMGFVFGAVLSLVGWYVWSFITYWVGTRLLPQPTTEADLGQLLRTLGFASAPGLLRALGVIPGIGTLAAAVSALWSLAAMVVAVRQALDYDSTGRAIAVCIVGWIVQVLIILIPLLLLGLAVGSVATQNGAAA